MLEVKKIIIIVDYLAASQARVISGHSQKGMSKRTARKLRGDTNEFRTTVG